MTQYGQQKTMIQYDQQNYAQHMPHASNILITTENKCISQVFLSILDSEESKPT